MDWGARLMAASTTAAWMRLIGLPRDYEAKIMNDLETLLKQSAERHQQHLCPRQVLGVRMGIYAGELFGLDLPQTDKRLFAFVETDGCLTDGIAVATGCW